MSMTDNTIINGENIDPDFKGVEENQSTFEDTRETNSEKTFTQSQLEAMISERLKRERKNTEALRKVRDLLLNLSNSGAIKSSSYAEMANELTSRLSQGENEKSEINSHTVGEDKDTLIENTEMEEQNSVCESIPSQEETVNVKDDIEQMKSETQKQSFFLTSEDARSIKEAYPGCDIGELLCDKSFEAFSRGRSGEPLDVYRDYLTFLTAYENKGEILERRMFANTADTSFSVSDKAYCLDGSEKLTKHQMEIAKQNGMSYREYSSLLSSIPRSPKI